MIMQNSILEHHMSNYKDLSVVQVKSFPNISIRQGWLFWGFYGYSTINHDYNLKTIGGDKVVVDNATGLMWHQSGSDDEMDWDDAKGWIESLNSEEGYAGYHDWRLPTVDEAASLLEQDMEASSQNGGMYTDPVFSTKQNWIWTGDKTDYKPTVFFIKRKLIGSEAAWNVFFYNGNVYWGYLIIFSYYVRPVRSME
jgi:hypothetical protein